MAADAEAQTIFNCSEFVGVTDHKAVQPCSHSLQQRPLVDHVVATHVREQ